MKKKLMAVLVAAGMVVSMAACGGASSESQTAAPAAETVESSEAEAGELTTVTPGKLTMSTNAAFPPYEMTTDDGKLEGIDIEVARYGRCFRHGRAPESHGVL